MGKTSDNVLVGINFRLDGPLTAPGTELSTTLESESKDPYSNDLRDMERLGRKQQVKRDFREWSLLAFTCINTSTWEYLMLNNEQALTSGGGAGFFWSYIWCIVLFGFLSASIAEMASMAPTAGGQYHWVAEFAPQKYQKFLSYITGWLCLLSWLAGNAYGFLLSGSLLETVITAYLPTYEIIPWRSTLMVFPTLIVATLINVGLARHLPVLQNCTMIVHIVGCVLIIVTLWVTAPHVDVKNVVLEFANTSGWNNWFVVMMLGQLSSQSALASTDSAAHMAEEVQDAGIAVPRAIMNALWLNGIMGFLLMVVFLFSLPNLDEALAHEGGSFFYVVKLAWPTTGYLYILWIMWLLIFLGNIPFAASAGRLMFALARDGALPFPKVLAHINRRFRVPANSILAVSGFVVVMSFVNLGSPAAFSAILSLSAAAQMSCYCISISCVLWRRITRPHTLPQARWSLGRHGVFINVIGIIFSASIMFWSLWPASLPVTIENFNFAGIVSVGTIVLCSATYFFYGHKVYTSPVDLVKGRQD